MTRELSTNLELRNKLFFLIRKVFLNGSDNFCESSFSQDDCRVLLEFSNQQKILPIVYQALKQIDILKCDNENKKWDELYHKYVYDYYQREVSLKNIFQTLNSEGIHYIPLKWAVVRLYYPEKWMRSSSDIDVLVAEKDLDNAIKALEQYTDFHVCGPRSYHDIPLCNKKVHLDLHFSIKQKDSSVDDLLVQVWDYSVPTTDECMMQLLPEYHIVYMLAHMSNHMKHGGIGVRPFLDLWLINQQTQFDEQVLHELLEKSGLQKFYEVSLKMIDSWMNSSLPDKDTILLEEYCLRGGVFGDATSVAAANQRKYHGTGYFIRRIFADRELLQEEYPELREKKHRLLWCQMKRWTRVFDKRKRKIVTREIRTIRETNPDEIDRFNQLLESLGL